MWLVLASFPVAVVKFPDKKELQGGRDYLELHFKVSVHSGGGMKAAGACEGGHITSQSGTKTGGGCYAPHFFISCSPSRISRKGNYDDSSHVS